MSGAARLYRFLLRLYPRSYREDFGAEMLQTFLDWHEDVTRAYGRVGIGRWLAMIADELANIATQRLTSLAGGDPLKFSRPTLLKLAVCLPVFFFLVTAAVPWGRPSEPPVADVTTTGPTRGAPAKLAAHDSASLAPADTTHTAVSSNGRTPRTHAR